MLLFTMIILRRLPVVLVLLAALPLAGCGVEGVGAVAAAEVVAIPVFHRSLPDMLVSGASGRDCSVVRLDRGETYCRDPEPPPTRPSFCTRSLGVVDCWTNPEALNGPPAREVADGARALTPAQESNRTRRWPGL